MNLNPGLNLNLIQTATAATAIGFCRADGPGSTCELSDGERKKCRFYEKGFSGHCMFVRLEFDNMCDCLEAQLA